MALEGGSHATWKLCHKWGHGTGRHSLAHAALSARSGNYVETNSWDIPNCDDTTNNNMIAAQLIIHNNDHTTHEKI